MSDSAGEDLATRRAATTNGTKEKESATLEDSQKSPRTKNNRGSGNAFAKKDSTFTKIFVGGLPYATGDEGLRKHFEQYGEIEEAVVIRDRQTGKSRGYGFVTMKAKEAAQLAVAIPNPIIDGRKANVNLAYLGAKPKGSQTNATGLQAAVNQLRVPPLLPPSLLPPYFLTNPTFGASFAPFSPYFAAAAAAAAAANGNQSAYAGNGNLSLSGAADGEHYAQNVNMHVNEQVFMPTVYSNGMFAGSPLSIPPTAVLQASTQQQAAPRYQLAAHNGNRTA